jgi:hypothetical protein
VRQFLLRANAINVALLLHLAAPQHGAAPPPPPPRRCASANSAVAFSGSGSE